jgi:hypothetical protein
MAGTTPTRAATGTDAITTFTGGTAITIADAITARPAERCKAFRGSRGG